MSEKDQTEEIEPWLRKIHLLFLGMDNGRTPEEGLTSFRIAKKMVVSHGTKFSDEFLPVKIHMDTFARVDEEISNLSQTRVARNKKLKEKENNFHKLCQKHWRLTEDVNALEQKAYEVCHEYFCLMGRQAPPSPVVKEHKQLDAQKNKEKPKANSKMEMPERPALIKEAHSLLLKLDAPSADSAEQAAKRLMAFLSSKDVLIADVFVPKPKEHANIDLLEKSLFSRIVQLTRLQEEIEALKERNSDLNYQIKQIDAEIYNLEGMVAGARHDMGLWSKKLQEAKKKAATFTATTGTGPQTSTRPTGPTPQPQPTPQPPPSQPTPQPPPVQPTPQPQPQPGTTRIVTPPPRQPATPTPGPTTTQTPPQQPKPTPKKKSIWTWPFRHPVIAVAASCVLYFGGSYAIPAVGDLFSRAAQQVSTPAPPSPYQTPDSSQNRGNGYAPQAQRTHYQTFYVAYDPISFWKKVTNGNGSQRIDMLHFGDQVQVELPDGQDRIYDSDKWVHIKDANNREGYVMGKQLSATVPVRAPVEPEPTPIWSAPAPQRTTEETSQSGYDATEPYKRQAIQAYICAGRLLTGTVDGTYLTIDSNTPIRACVSFYSVHGGSDTKMQICSYRNGAEAKIFVSDPSIKDGVFVPYDAVSLDRNACTQTQVLRGYHAEP